jgi:cob(I)alamin adenosyltransferase
LVHAYIGYGKGKTTASVGVAVRARGYGLRVLFLQFMKSTEWPSGERKPLQRIGVDVRVMGQGFYQIMGDKKSPALHKAAAVRALEVGRRALLSGLYDLVILDELGTAIEEGLLKRSPVEAMLKSRAQSRRAKQAHFIWTGHKRLAWMLKYADLVTEMKKVKHPFDRGMMAVKGIDY